MKNTVIEKIHHTHSQIIETVDSKDKTETLEPEDIEDDGHHHHIKFTKRQEDRALKNLK